MGGRVTQERDLRSLDRAGLRHTFAPLDAAERLPRELFLESHNRSLFGQAVDSRDLRRRIAVLLWLPALGVALVIASWLHWNGFIGGAATLVLIGILSAVLWLFAEKAS